MKKKSLVIVYLPVTVYLFEKWAQAFQIQNSEFILSLTWIIEFVLSCGSFEAQNFPDIVSSYEVFPILFYVNAFYLLTYLLIYCAKNINE